MIRIILPRPLVFRMIDSLFFIDSISVFVASFNNETVDPT